MDTELHVPGYQMHRFDRTLDFGKSGGGDLVSYDRNNYEFELIAINGYCGPDLETFWLKLSLKKIGPT